MLATVFASFTSTSIGSYITPRYSARHLSWPIASLTAGASTFGALTTTFAATCVPGNAAFMRLYVFKRFCGNVSMLGVGRVQLDGGHRQGDEHAGGESGRQSGAAEHAVDDRSPDPTLAVVAPQPVHERHAKPVDVVAELREQRRQDRQRAEHRDRDHRHRRRRRTMRSRRRR